jgi:hypothetical protein
MAKLDLFAAVVASVAFAVAPPASATSPGPAVSEDPPSPTVSGLTVTAPEKPNPAVGPASQFVRQHLPENIFSDQYPRFRDEICVRVQGLPPEFDTFVAARIIAIASQVHAPVAKGANCTPNVNVIFTTAPQAQVDDIYNRRDILLGFRFHSQVKRVTTFERPIQAWYLTRTRGDNGASVLEVENALVPWTERPIGRAGSRLANGVSAEVVHTLILADAAKVADEKIGTIADYIAVLALARWQHLERCSPRVSTVLNFMADGCDVESRPESATAADLALLTGLYAVDPRENGAQQRATIAGAVHRAGTAIAKPDS